MTTDARVLASAMGALDDAVLRRLLVARGVSPTATWRDLFDAAEALLAPASVEQALRTLPRPALSALWEAVHDGRPVDAEHLPDLDRLALLRPDGVPFTVVEDATRGLLGTRPDSLDSADSSSVVPASHAAAAIAAERAGASTAALADVVVACLVAPLVRTGAGGVIAADRRRMVEAGVVDSPEDLEELLDIALRAGLLAPLDREWVVTEDGERWLGRSTSERWRTVADGLSASLPRAIATVDGAWIPVGLWPAAVPLDPAWPPRATALKHVIERWGLIAPDGSEPAWTTGFRESGRFDVEALAALLPPEIDRIYLQADLTAIAPGVLAPELDLRLRMMAHRESRAQASTYRFTDESLAAAIADGEDAAGIREFLARLSLTGIPQPLDYLIERAAARHGRILIRTDPESGRTRVESDDPRLLDTVAVDQALRALGLVSDGMGLSSRVSRDAVYWSLADARYPVVALDASGAPEPLHRRRIAPSPNGASPDAYARLLDVLRRSQDADTDAAWLDRELDAAVRARATIVIVVALPGGENREFTIEATGLGGGRLRGRDRNADTERTLPVRAS